jgi:hypothetical protein
MYGKWSAVADGEAQCVMPSPGILVVSRATMGAAGRTCAYNLGLQIATYLVIVSTPCILKKYSLQDLCLC